MTSAIPIGRRQPGRRLPTVLAVVLAVAALGATATPANAAGQPLTYTGLVGYPRLVAPEGVAVDSNGDVIVAEPTVAGTSTNDRIAKFSASGTFLDVIAGPGTATGQVDDPTGVAVAPNGDLYTVEKGGSIDRLQRFDALGNFVSSIGLQGTAAGQFKNPEGVAVDDNGLVYVADTGNFRIQVFDPTLLPGDPLVNSWCVVDGGVSGCQNSVTGIAVSGSTVYAVGGATVYTYDRATGTPGTSWSSAGATGVAADASGNVWVSSTNDLVNEYSPSGVLIATEGTGQLVNPQGLVISGNHLFVADTGQGRIARFAPSGLDTSWSVTGATGVAVDSGVVYATDGSNVQTFDTSGSPGASWSSAGATGITVDGSGDIWVSRSSGVVSEYDSSGNPLGADIGGGTLASPQGIAVAGGKLYVADTGKIYRFSVGSGALDTSWAFAGVNGVAVSGGTVYASGGGSVKTFDTNGVGALTWSSAGASGIALDGNGDVWVGSSSSSLVREFNANGTIAMSTIGSGQVTTPKGLAIAGSKLFVADIGANKVFRFSIVDYQLEWGQYGLGVPDTPTGLAVDASGNTYVTNRADNSVQKFAPDGTFLLAFTGSGITLLNQPGALAIGPTGNVYVVDTANNRIEVFSSTGTYLDRWGSSGSSPGQFNSPAGIAVDASGNVYVADTGNNRIEKFDASKTLVWTAGTLGVSGGQFKQPKGIALDASGNVWVADTNNSRIEKFDGAGNYVTTWGTQGSLSGQLSGPTALVFDSAGLLYVSDTGNNRIEIFQPDGTFLSKLGSAGLDTGQFASPMGLAIDPTSAVTRLLVADSANHRIEAFVDNVGPDTTLGNAPGVNTNATTVSFTFTANDLNATFECKIDGAVSWDATCNGSPSGHANYTGLTEGPHTFAVRARDVSNNPGNPTTFDWTVDLTPPTVSLTGGPTEGQVNNNANPSFSFDADEPVLGYACSLDGAAFATCVSGDSFAVAEGAHTFVVRATDLAGNTGLSATRHWTTDLTKPTVSITSGPSGITVQTTATFDFTSPSDANATFSCQIDGGGFSPCDSGSWTYPPPVSAGQHIFQVYATDAHLNDSSIAQRKWTVDSSTHRPDALIATGTSYLGDDVYNGTGSGQTKTLKTKVGATAKFKVEVQNDGNDLDPITVHGPGSGNGYTVSYFDGTTNITSAVKAGTCTFSLDHNQTHIITVKVKVGSSAAASKSLLVTVTSGHDPSKSDSVKAIVKRV